MGAGWVSQTHGHGPWINHDHPDWRITLVINGDIQVCRVTYKDRVLRDFGAKGDAETFAENIAKIMQVSGGVGAGETPPPTREARLTRAASAWCVPTEGR